ncbi:DUF3267 domain-containing protein [Oscillospiraceae bacterium PP1C4]
MFFIPGILISIITFPGVIVHELAHQLFCRIMRVPVYEVKYFQFANPCGYVIHEGTEKPLTNFMISTGPFLINTLLGAGILFPVAIEILEFQVYKPFINGEIANAGTLIRVPVLLVAWLGISILMHSFPSTGDADAMVSSILKNKNVNIFVKILVTPVIGLIYLGAVGSILWLDLVYALAIGAVLPSFIAQFL